MNSVPTTCPLGMPGGGLHTIAVSKQEMCLFSHPPLYSVINISVRAMLRCFTFTERLGAVPGAVLGADEGGGPVGVHRESRRTLEGGGVVVGEVVS